MRAQNILLAVGVVAMAVLPLALVSPGHDGAPIFTGSDDHAARLIETLRPGYRRLMAPLWEPPSAEIESLMFGVQSALGAGALAYCLGYWRGRRQGQRTARRDHAARD
jgi:cobalt/nickel transport protein